MNELTSADIDLLNERQIAIAATIMPDGGIQLTPVWVDTDGQAVLFNTAKGRVKYTNLQRNPEIAISVIDSSNSARWLSVSGRAQLVDDGADEHIDRLAKKYLGEERYPFRQLDEERVIVRVSPIRRLAMP